tara:strand:+ start:29 stop:655 length:627 start_codon:yes stop_codon:yes gene_type:complete
MSLTSYQNRDINPLANLSDFIWSKEKSLSESFCENMIEKFDESDHQQYDGVIGTGQTDPWVKQTRDLIIGSHLDDWQEEDDILYKSLKDGLDEYSSYLDSIHSSLVFSSLIKLHDAGFQIQRYEPDGFYEWHHDWSMKDGCSRLWTFIWYLNTIKTEDGGYTQFIDGTKVQPKAGKLIIFPATWNYLHRAFPPKVRKYIATGWVYGRL